MQRDFKKVLNTWKTQVSLLILEEKKVPFGIKISGEELGFNKNVLSIPFYLTGQLPRLIDSIS